MQNSLPKTILQIAAVSIVLSHLPRTYGAPLTQLTGSYFGRAYDTVNNLQTGPTATSLSGALSYTLPNIDYELSGTANSVVVTSDAIMFGSAALDQIHVYQQATNTISGPAGTDVGTAELFFELSGSDTITPFSGTLAQNTPVEFQFFAWTEGAYSPSGTCPRSTLQFSGSIFDSININGCPGGPFQVTTQPRDITLNIGQPYTFNWAMDATMQSTIGYIEGPADGNTLHGLDTSALNIQSVTPGVSFTSASGATYQLQPVPEPSSLLLLLIGLGSIAAVSCQGMRARIRS